MMYDDDGDYGGGDFGGGFGDFQPAGLGGQADLAPGMSGVTDPGYGHDAFGMPDMNVWDAHIQGALSGRSPEDFRDIGLGLVHHYGGIGGLHPSVNPYLANYRYNNGLPGGISYEDSYQILYGDGGNEERENTAGNQDYENSWTQNLSFGPDDAWAGQQGKKDDGKRHPVQGNWEEQLGRVKDAGKYVWGKIEDGASGAWSKVRDAMEPEKKEAPATDNGQK